ncbi:hypothetical protein B9T36_13710 [Acinetobacter sp. ANC 4204]|nr:hypothetical protein B9T36_13710 [Acinetobacter sp. ANC 4204]RGD92203.1 hypothetical protein DYI96_06530 [Acinetobacter sp. SWAC57]
MKKTLLGMLFMLTTSVVMANTPNQTEVTQASNQNNIRVMTRPEIVGLWGMELPNNRKCVEYYNFKSNSDVVIKSGEEWSTGIYDYQPSNDQNVQLPALILQVKYDNNEVDCSGLKEDQSGEMSQYFVKWKSPSTINFCANDKGQQCFATLRRVLP